MARMDAAASFTEATNAKALSEQSIAKLVVRKALSFPDWTVSLRSARGNRHCGHFQADTVV